MPGASSAAQTALLLLVDIEPRARAWGWSRLALGPRGLPRGDSLRFAKVLGSGDRGGFGLRPSSSIIGLFCVFDDDAGAAAFRRPDGPLRGWFERSTECFSVELKAVSVRGRWSGQSLSVADGATLHGPVASLTRASIRPTRAIEFWRLQPAAERSLRAAEGCRLAVGLGEAPLLRQATFTIWQDVAAMERYARSGAHLQAIEAATRGRYFSESMFVRFTARAPRGTWRGNTIA